MLLHQILGVLLLLAWQSAAHEDILFPWAKARWYNPSLVEFGGQFVSAAKVTSFKRSKYKTWWINHLFMCQGSKPNFKALRCSPYDPFKGKYRECEFDTRIKGGKLDTSGLGDVKVWRWPGKGVYAIFGRKPERTKDEPFCSGQQVYYQYLVQVVSERELSAAGSQRSRHAAAQQARAASPRHLLSTVGIGSSTVAGSTSDWDIRWPLQLHMSGSWTYPKNASFIMEKNWMPFVYKDRQGTEHLYATHMVQPHRVISISPSGAATVMHETRDPQLFAKFAQHDVHGGPPVVYVPGSFTKGNIPYYLGIMHHIERFDNNRVRLYRHFAFKFEAQPPFRILDISDELPLHFHKDPARPRTMFVAFVSGLWLSNEGVVYITYGSADMQARLMQLPLVELEGMFTKSIAFLPQNVSMFTQKHL